MAYLYIRNREFPVESAVENYRILADAFTVPALLFLMFGALLWAAGKGAVDGVSYAFTWAIKSLLPGARLASKDLSYAAYVEEKREKRKKSRGFSFLFFCGLGFMAVTAVFIFLFYKNR